jgi:hypothetical protein
VFKAADKMKEMKNKSYVLFRGFCETRETNPGAPQKIKAKEKTVKNNSHRSLES